MIYPYIKSYQNLPLTALLWLLPTTMKFVTLFFGTYFYSTFIFGPLALSASAFSIFLLCCYIIND